MVRVRVRVGVGVPGQGQGEGQCQCLVPNLSREIDCICCCGISLKTYMCVHVCACVWGTGGMCMCVGYRRYACVWGIGGMCMCVWFVCLSVCVSSQWNNTHKTFVVSIKPPPCAYTIQTCIHHTGGAGSVVCLLSSVFIVR